MKPIAPLMIEHRVIERVLLLLEKENSRISETGRLDKVFVDKAVDFFEVFVDRFHHGKEEFILFAGLSAKPLSENLRETMGQLIAEHAHTRKALEEFRHEWYSDHGKEKLLSATTKLFGTLIKWYPVHIDKEDRHFFVPSQKYLDETDQADMAVKMETFDKTFVREKYAELIKEWESSATPGK